MTDIIFFNRANDRQGLGALLSTAFPHLNDASFLLIGNSAKRYKTGEILLPHIEKSRQKGGANNARHLPFAVKMRGNAYPESDWTEIRRHVRLGRQSDPSSSSIKPPKSQVFNGFCIEKNENASKPLQIAGKWVNV